MTAHFILYVADQKRNARFYERVLGLKPQLDVGGMTEFALGGGAVLGLMPSAGAKRLLGEGLPDPEAAQGSRAELYLLVDDPGAARLGPRRRVQPRPRRARAGVRQARGRLGPGPTGSGADENKTIYLHRGKQRDAPAGL